MKPHICLPTHLLSTGHCYYCNTKPALPAPIPIEQAPREPENPDAGTQSKLEDKAESGAQGRGVYCVRTCLFCQRSLTGKVAKAWEPARGAPRYIRACIRLDCRDIYRHMSEEDLVSYWKTHYRSWKL